MSIKRTALSVFAFAAMAALPGLAAAQSAGQTGGQPAVPQRANESSQVVLRALPTDGKIANLQDLVGKTAYDFTLTDTDGNEHTLSEYLNQGKIVVLEWFNFDCPIVKRHYNGEYTMNDTVARYKDKDVVWLAIASGNSADKDYNRKARERWNMAHPILLDASGAVGKAYGSKNTPTMYVISTDGTLAYGGGIDDNPRGRSANPTNYVIQAVDALLAGSNVETAYAKPYGCSVKYRR